jgi:hypothetical protein
MRGSGVSARGLPPLPHTTPQTLRRTYISIALLANRFDVLWVMGQVGHADSKMTMDVYAQLRQRVKREHGRAFDRLVDQAREQLYGTDSEALESPTAKNPTRSRKTPAMARPGLEPGTPRFSVVCSTN